MIMTTVVGGAVPTASATSSASTTSSVSPTASAIHSGSNPGLSTGAKVGIGVGVPLGVILLGLGAFFLIRRRRRTKASVNPSVATSGGGAQAIHNSSFASDKKELHGTRYGQPAELPGSHPAAELSTQGGRSELPAHDMGTSRFDGVEKR